MEEVNPDLVAASALSSALRSLPPSAEVLQFYRERLRSFEGEERRWLRKLSAARGLARKTVDLEVAKNRRHFFRHAFCLIRMHFLPD